MADQLTFDFGEEGEADSSLALSDLLPRDWREALADEFEKPYFGELEKFLTKEYQEKEVFPKKSDLFSAFHRVPLESAKVLLLGQDPYHDNGQAHGLSFSVLPGVKIPPSLRNM